MGALHEGHLTLVQKASETCDIVVCSIFVNPTQFNNAIDLDKYPRTLEADLELLESQTDCHVVFAPETPEEVYNHLFTKPKVDLEGLDTMMEGAFRPGHFEGVVSVVSQLFKLVEPQFAFFGEKDFQQLAVIRRMTEIMELPVEIVGCTTSREENGLAKSSRNKRLSSAAKETAGAIHEALQLIKSKASQFSVSTCLDLAKTTINGHPELEVEYLVIADGHSLQEVSEWHETTYAVACTAVYAEGVRLIDNVTIFS